MVKKFIADDSAVPISRGGIIRARTGKIGPMNGVFIKKDPERKGSEHRISIKGSPKGKEVADDEGG